MRCGRSSAAEARKWPPLRHCGALLGSTGQHLRHRVVLPPALTCHATHRQCNAAAGALGPIAGVRSRPAGAVPETGGGTSRRIAARQLAATEPGD